MSWDLKSSSLPKSGIQVVFFVYMRWDLNISCFLNQEYKVFVHTICDLNSSSSPKSGIKSVCAHEVRFK